VNRAVPAINAPALGLRLIFAPLFECSAQVITQECHPATLPGAFPLKQLFSRRSLGILQVADLQPGCPQLIAANNAIPLKTQRGINATRANFFRGKPSLP
jgi:hypothetical protein